MHVFWNSSRGTSPPGACSGVLATNLESAISLNRAGLPVVFCSQTPTPDAMRPLPFSVGAVFQTRGATSHVAVIARGMGKPCILGIAELDFSQKDLNEIKLSQTTIPDGEWISIDGANGHIYLGQKEIARTSMTENSPLHQVLTYCDKVSKIQVYVNADNASEASLGFNYGAKGIGLCRMEHMLLHPDIVDDFNRALIFGLASIDISAELYRTELKSLIWKDSFFAIKKSNGMLFLLSVPLLKDNIKCKCKVTNKSPSTYEAFVCVNILVIKYYSFTQFIFKFHPTCLNKYLGYML